mmetsp:Transcript_20351/g.28606  ORF Transcript_20351/g.28606 Transcript_20351/m.28606 type:complete len:147 (+) Transcript_20351:4534-4974(+)
MDCLKNKVLKAQQRGYLEDGYVANLINFSAVPKGKDDIRVVYDGTKCLLNKAVWAPNFFLPMVDSLLMFISPNTWFSDMDLGGMFLNYPLDMKLQPYSGIDCTGFNEEKGIRWLRWNRVFIGFTASPYIATQMYSINLDVICGDRR